MKKSDLVKNIKMRMAEDQKYESAAMIRDIERSLTEKNLLGGNVSDDFYNIFITEIKKYPSFKIDNVYLREIKIDFLLSNYLIPTNRITI
jgi:hypothetical protein